MADDTLTGARRPTKERLGDWATNPMTVLVARIMTGLGMALASVAVWVFLETRSDLRTAIDQANSTLSSVQSGMVESQKQVQSVAERVAVQQQQIIQHDRELIEQQRRLNRLEQKVFP